MNNIKNKKAQLGDMMLVGVFLFVLLVIGFGIFLGTTIFFGGDIDFRSLESQILEYKIERCVLEKDVNSFFEKADISGFLETCGLNLRVNATYGIYFEICDGSCFTNWPEKGGVLLSTGGDFSQCNFEGTKENLNYPKCLSSSLEKDGKEYWIVTASNQKIRR